MTTLLDHLDRGREKPLHLRLASIGAGVDGREISARFREAVSVLRDGDRETRSGKIMTEAAEIRAYQEAGRFEALRDENPDLSQTIEKVRSEPVSSLHRVALESYLSTLGYKQAALSDPDRIPRLRRYAQQMMSGTGLEPRLHRALTTTQEAFRRAIEEGDKDQVMQLGAQVKSLEEAMEGNLRERALLRIESLVATGMEREEAVSRVRKDASIRALSKNPLEAEQYARLSAMPLLSPNNLPAPQPIRLTP